MQQEARGLVQPRQGLDMGRSPRARTVHAAAAGLLRPMYAVRLIRGVYQNKPASSDPSGMGPELCVSFFLTLRTRISYSTHEVLKDAARHQNQGI